MNTIQNITSNNKSETNLNKVLCLGSGYVGVLSMSVFAHFHSNIQFTLYDKSKSLTEKWNRAGRNYKSTLNSNEENCDTKLIGSQDHKTKLPILENKFEQIFKNVFDKNLFFKDDLKEEVLTSDVIFICVNTPSTVRSKIKTNLSMEEIQKEISQGIELNLNYVYSCIDEICQVILDSARPDQILKERIIVQKSTVTLKTLKNLHDRIKDFYTVNSEKLKKIIQSHNTTEWNLDENNFDIEAFVSKYYRLVNIPEFLAEGSAMTNLIDPDRVIIGYLKPDNKQVKNSYSKCAAETMKAFYTKWIDPERIIEIDSNSSELIKLVSNAFLAQRISSINSISQLCEMSESNINNLSTAVGMDQRIGKNYLKATMGFGGSCFKKDILSLIFILNQKNLTIEANYWMHVLVMNEYQRLRIANLIRSSVLTDSNQSLSVSIFGLAFKGDIKDVRQSNAVFLISYLIENEIEVHVFDDLVDENDLLNELKLYQSVSEDITNIKDVPYLRLFQDYKECVKQTQSLVFCTNHTFFREIDLNELSNLMNESCCVFDLYDIFKLEQIEKTKFKIFKLGECNQI